MPPDKKTEKSRRIFEELILAVERGGNLTDECDVRGLEYGRVYEAINASREWGGRLRRAEEVRKNRLSEAWNREVTAIATSDVREVFDKDDKIRPVHEWSRGVASAVKKISFDKFGNVGAVEFYSKPAGLALLGKGLGLLGQSKEMQAGLKEIIASRLESEGS